MSEDLQVLLRTMGTNVFPYREINMLPQVKLDTCSAKPQPAMKTSAAVTLPEVATPVAALTPAEPNNLKPSSGDLNAVFARLSGKDTVETNDLHALFGRLSAVHKD
ncbi:MAG: hypothetical protein AB1400_09660 [Pseudomonadota bacterium]